MTLKNQAATLRDEREGLEASVSEAHQRIVKMLTDLGDDALYLTTPAGTRSTRS